MAVQVTKLAEGALGDVAEIIPDRFADDRGYFSEVYSQGALAGHGIDLVFVQDNQSLSGPVGTVRGLHFQSPPYAQAKLVRVLKGSILDVAVDIRIGSPAFGKFVSRKLTAAQGNQLLVPEGFAHGFCTLEADTEIHYKVSAPYSREHDFGLLWSDPSLGIDWPVNASTAVLSEKDKVQPTLDAIESQFNY